MPPTDRTYQKWDECFFCDPTRYGHHNALSVGICDFHYLTENHIIVRLFCRGKNTKDLLHRITHACKARQIVEERLEEYNKHLTQQAFQEALHSTTEIDLPPITPLSTRQRRP